MDTEQIQVLSAIYSHRVFSLKIGAVMAIRAYGACLEGKCNPSYVTVEAFYEAIRPMLIPEYAGALAHLSSHEQRYLEQQIARRVYRVIADMAAGSTSR